MNKIIFLYFAFMSSFSLAANKAEIEVTTVNNLGFKTDNKITIDNNNLYFDSEKIDPTQFPILMPSLKTLLQLKIENMKNCYAGTFTHRVTKNKKTSQSSGCLNSKQAERLLISLEKLKRSKAF